MQLKRLEAYGFKSFADKIALEFDKGITAIVGPNGSGKSNITDAVRWVLGEQSARSLRILKAQDLIFTGSAGRKALGVAEVSLYFENDGTLPLDYNEVVVTRRLYKSGDSEYYINKNRVRLKDIYNLFADTGIGHDGMSIIGQNRIDDILNSRPEERRAFFEETAGITKYRNRKRETLKKIEATELNLVRVQDIISEITSQLEPLERQAAKTREYNEINAKFQKYRLTKIAGSYRLESERKAKNDAALINARDAITTVETEERQQQAAKETLSKEIIDLEQELKNKAGENEKIRNKLAAAGTSIATLREREEQENIAKEKILRDREKLNHDIAAIVGEMGKLSEKEQQEKAKLAVANDKLAVNRTKSQELAQNIRAQKEIIKEKETLNAKRFNELAAERQRLAVIERDIASDLADNEEQKKALAAEQAKLTNLEKILAKLELAINTKEKDLAAASDSYNAAAKNTQNLESAAKELEKDYAKALQELKVSENKADFIAHLQETYEGFNQAVKAILKADKKINPWRGKIAGAVAELITVPKEYITAIEIALGGNLQNIVTEDTDAAKAAINYLKQTKKGRATFLPLSTIVAREPKNINFSSADGVLGWAADLVNSDSRYQKIIKFLLSRTIIVDNLDNGLKLAKKLGYKERIVTLEGELLNPGGSLSGGARINREASFMSRSGELSELKKIIASKQAELKKINADLLSARENMIASAANEKALADNINSMRLELAADRTNSDSLTKSISEEQAKIADVQQSLARLSDNFAKMQNEKAALAKSIKEIAFEQQTAEKELARLSIELDDLEDDADSLAGLVHEQEVRAALLEQEIVQLRQHSLLRAKEKERAENSLIASEQEEKALIKALADSKNRLLELEKNTADWENLFSAGRAEHDKIYASRMEKLALGQGIEKKLQDIARRLNKLKDDLHKLELVDAKLIVTLNDFSDLMLKDFGLTPARALEDALAIDDEALASKIAALETKLEELGAVNPHAINEYEELKARHDFMTGQVDDLIAAKADLEKILVDMDKAMTQQFSEAFSKIQEYFAEIFVRLFGGGSAELKLLDDSDVLNSGIEIMVTVPQKKRQNLAALSGGERALTVIALLFAFLKYKPSPFSVLDEIDAPLDEANVVRFGNFLKEFSADTQFIVVTHRKGTMEAADTMYGVTIEDAGVSSMLSVKLADKI